MIKRKQMSLKSIDRSRSASIAFTLLLVAGCSDSGSDLGKITGTVTFDGQPLADATVLFRPEASGRASMARTDAEGHYELVYLRDIRGALVGRHRVTITTADERQPVERLPERYHAKTELAVDVRLGAQVADFDLAR